MQLLWPPFGGVERRRKAGRDHRVRLGQLPRRDRGGRAMEIVEYDADGAPLRLNGEYVRDENSQARYLRELLEIFDTEGVGSAFVFLFALDSFPHRPHGDPRYDLDLASPGIVKMREGRHAGSYPGMAWEPKAAFTAVAQCYGR
jgi:hypothetical protein